MNKYLARIQTEKRPSQTTALAAKSTLGSKGSDHHGHILKINASQESQTIPAWCSTDCAHFDPAELPGRPPVPGCFSELPIGWLWRPLCNMESCPMRNNGKLNHRGAQP